MMWVSFPNIPQDLVILLISNYQDIITSNASKILGVCNKTPLLTNLEIKYIKSYILDTLEQCMMLLITLLLS